jgi:N-acetylated-alpha-linked acidic dipeptidase
MRTVHLKSVVCAAWLVASACSAQEASPLTREQLAARVVGMVEPTRLRDMHMALAAEPHVAGTPGDARTIERLEAMFREAGLKVTRHEIWPLLCKPISASLEIIGPEKKVLDVAERPLKEDPYSDKGSFGWNAYSGSGVVEGRVVYANYGTRQDFAKLKELGIDCTGAIVLARYGGNYRGFKVKFAQEAGAAGIVIFTDPGDSGFVKGPVYPQGGYANECCIQRGSIVTMPFQGDPLTPGREATEHVERMKMEEAVLPRIPCQPIGYAAAKEILASMKGAEAPQAWQGGLGFPYRLTSDDGAQVGTRLKLSVQQERAIMKTANVIAEIPGTEHPEQRIRSAARSPWWRRRGSMVNWRGRGSSLGARWSSRRGVRRSSASSAAASGWRPTSGC